MSYVTSRKHRHTGYYVDSFGKRKSAGTFDSAEEALAAAITAESSPFAAIRTPVVQQKYSTYVSIWLVTDDSILSSTKRGYESVMRKHVLPLIGDLPVSEITSLTVRSVLSALMQKGASSALRAQCKAAIGSSFRSLVPAIVAVNPTHGVKVAVQPAKPFELLAPEAAGLIIDQLPPEAQLFASVLIETGARYGEAIELRVKDINLRTNEVSFLRRALSVPKNQNHGSRFMIVDGTKAGTNRGRTLVLSQDTIDEIKTWIDAHELKNDDLLFPKHLVIPREYPDLINPENGQEFQQNGHTYKHGTNTGYTNGKCRCEDCRTAMRYYRREWRKKRANQQARSTHMPNDSWRRVWRKAIERSGIGWYPRTHDLRHANATHLVADGVSIYEVMQRLGHRSIETTLKYQHRVDAQRSKATQSAASILNRRSARKINSDDENLESQN